jgi:hypothetical protein
MNKIITLNEYKQTKTYAFGKTYEATKQKLTYLCDSCKKEHTVNIATKKQGHKGSIDYFLNKPCKNCVKKIESLDRLLVKAKTKFNNNEFDYSLINLSNFQSGAIAVPIKCNKHNIVFNTSLYNHTAKPAGPNNPNKGGCPICAKEAQQQAETFTVLKWTTRLNKKFPHITFNSTLSDEDKLLGSTKGEFICKYHGPFDSTFHNMNKEVHFCKLCAQDNNSWGGRTRRTDIKGTLYLIHIPLLNV